MTNSNLIPVFNGLIQNQPVQLCNARELHAFVESKQEYATWIKNRINEYGFIQDEDYFIITERTNGRPRKEYHITLDMGKELGMVERNERGRQIRQYFIRCERTLKALQQPKQLELSETKGKKQRGLLPPKNPFGYMTYEREFTARELEWLVLSWYQAYEYRELLKQLFPMLEAAQSALLTPIKNRIASSDMDFKLSADVLFRITRGTDVMRLAPLITLENYVQ